MGDPYPDRQWTLRLPPLAGGCGYTYGRGGDPTGSTLPARMSLDVREWVDRRGHARSGGGGRVRNRISVTRRRRSFTGQLVGKCSLIRS